MSYQVDQSGKVENTQKLTVTSYANGKTKTLLITAIEKRKLLIAMRALSHPKRTFVFRIFAGLVFLLIKDEEIDLLVIDREYPGQEALIRNTLISLFNKVHKRPPEIVFDEIGKESKAHQAALATFQGKRKADILVKARNILGLFYSKKRKPRL